MASDGEEDVQIIGSASIGSSGDRNRLGESRATTKSTKHTRAAFELPGGNIWCFVMASSTSTLKFVSLMK